MTDIRSLDEKQQEKKASGYAATFTSRKIYGLLSACRNTRVLGLVTGVTGTGKSTSAKRFLEQHQRAVYVKASRVTAEVRPFITQLCNILDLYIEDRAGTAAHFDRIVRSLADRGSYPLLIVDEVQLLTLPTIEVIRDLCDLKIAGVALIGNAEFSSLLYNKKAKATFSQLAPLRARIMLQDDFPAPFAEDIGALCDFHKISNAEAQKIVYRIAQQEGGLHRVGGLLKLAESFDEKNPRSYQAIRSAARMMKGAS